MVIIFLSSNVADISLVGKVNLGGMHNVTGKVYLPILDKVNIARALYCPFFSFMWSYLLSSNLYTNNNNNCLFYPVDLRIQ